MRSIVLALLLWCSAALAGEPAGQTASAQCAAAIATAQRSADIPVGLLTAIARVESGRIDPLSGVLRPWPWTIDADGTGYFFATKAAAVAAAAQFQAQGVPSIDVGCMQINLLDHPAAFASLAQAFDPLANALYAARFLRKLFRATGDWSAAVAAYHSQTRAVGAAYARKVLAARGWPRTPSPPAAGAAGHGFVMPDWIGAAAAAGPGVSPAPFAAPIGAMPAPIRAAASAWVVRVVAAVARCSPAIAARQPEAGQPTDRWTADRWTVWKAPGTCPSSPFAHPAILRRLLAQSRRREPAR
jgi:hypothetical protein